MAGDTRTWHHIVLTTYGAWLYGDSRGFRTRHHREHVDGDYKNPPPAETYAAKERQSRALLKQTPVVLSTRWRATLGNTLWQGFKRQGAWVLVMAIAGQHAHLLVKLPCGEARQRAGRAKRFATLKLRESGWQGELWGQRSKAVPIRNREHQQNTFRYILAHARAGAWVGVWKTEGGGRCTSE